jgi:hypothetical protein
MCKTKKSCCRSWERMLVSSLKIDRSAFHDFYLPLFHGYTYRNKHVKIDVS